MVHPAHQRRHAADLARTMPRPRPVGGAPVKRHADDRDVELFRVALDRQPHERRDLAEARHDHAGQRLGEFAGGFIGHRPTL